MSEHLVYLMQVLNCRTGWNSLYLVMLTTETSQDKAQQVRCAASMRQLNRGIKEEKTQQVRCAAFLSY